MPTLHKLKVLWPTKFFWF